MIAGCPSEHEEALASYGMHLGTAFQLIDDVLDYSASSEQLGKNVGDDLAEGKPTLPLIYAMREGTTEQAEVVKKAIESGGLDHIDAVLAAIESTGAISYTARAAEQAAEQAVAALAPIPASDYRTALEALATISVNRTF